MCCRATLTLCATFKCFDRSTAQAFDRTKCCLACCTGTFCDNKQIQREPLVKDSQFATTGQGGLAGGERLGASVHPSAALQAAIKAQNRLSCSMGPEDHDVRPRTASLRRDYHSRFIALSFLLTFSMQLFAVDIMLAEEYPAFCAGEGSLASKGCVVQVKSSRRGRADNSSSSWARQRQRWRCSDRTTSALKEDLEPDVSHSRCLDDSSETLLGCHPTPRCLWRHTTPLVLR